MDTGTSPTSIAFLAFTRKAAQEAKTRACQKFNFDPDKDLPFFRTIHSLAYRMSNVRESQLLQAEHFDELSKKIGVSMTVTRVSEDDDDAGVTSDHPILSLINLARLRKVTLRQQYDLSSIQHTWEEVSYVDRAYRAYKETMGLYDYTDILDKFVREGIAYCPRFQLTFMDEAQDLSPMQWDIAHALDDISDRMYCAGDDDQAIYRWAGADVDHFINLPGGAEILEQSYRIPASVHVVAERIASRIERRYKKVYKPRTEKGCVDRIYSVGELDMTQGGWLVMAQANYMLTPVADELKRAGLLFERNGRRSISERISLAVNGWESLRKGRTIDCTTAQAIYDYMSATASACAAATRNSPTSTRTSSSTCPRCSCNTGWPPIPTCRGMRRSISCPMLTKFTSARCCAAAKNSMRRPASNCPRSTGQKAARRTTLCCSRT